MQDRNAFEAWRIVRGVLYWLLVEVGEANWPPPPFPLNVDEPGARSEMTLGGRRRSAMALAMRMRFPNATMPSSDLRMLTSRSSRTSPVISCSTVVLEGNRV